MNKKQVSTQYSNRPKNLADATFSKKSDIKNQIDELINSAKDDPYQTSLALIASAEWGDKTRYAIVLKDMLNGFDNLDNTSDSAKKWMQNNSFKAWMWGRVLLAADSMDDADIRIKAKKKLENFLEKDFAGNDSLAFFTWAWAYRATLNLKEYSIAKKRMLDGAVMLAEQYQSSGDQGSLSDALWAWVMNLQASAFVGDRHSYDWIKEQIKSMAKRASVAEASVTQVLENGLLRTRDSNDYPAWAMAKVRYAAIVMNDGELYPEIENSLVSSIAGARRENVKAEYVLSILANQLCEHAASLQSKSAQSDFRDFVK